MFSFQENTDYTKIFPLVKQAGYDGVEPVLSDSGYLNMNSSHEDIMRIKACAEECGLAVPTVGVWSLWNHNLVSDDSSAREQAKNIIRKQLEIAYILGADTILVVPGYVGCEFAEKPERIRYDIAYERSLEAFCELKQDAEAAEVNIGIENVWNKFLLSPLEVKRFIDAVDSQYFGMYFDVGNILYTGYPEDWIRILGKRIKKIHVCDYRTSLAGVEAFVDLFAGDVNYPEVMKALHEIGYDDYLTLEMLPNYKMFPEAAVYSNKYALDQILRM